MKPYVIAINAVSGGGKTSLATILQRSLPDSVLFCFDDFDETNLYPDDFYEWWKRGEDLLEFDCVGMRAAVDEQIRLGSARFIVMDYPFGREHPRFQNMIDLSVYVDTPLDVAMARRIVRDYRAKADESASEAVERLRDEMAHYLVKARHVYLGNEKHRATCDVILDGCRDLEALKNEMLELIRAGSSMTRPNTSAS